jgi:transcriptional regulator with XRE-family HTH domain
MDSNINKIFGRNVARLRIQKGFSQEEFAFKCGVHRTYIGAIERGEKSPTLNTILKISRGLNLKMSELWEAMQID